MIYIFDNLISCTSHKKKLYLRGLEDFSTFIYELIFIKILMNANFIKMQIFIKSSTYNLKLLYIEGHIRPILNYREIAWFFITNIFKPSGQLLALNSKIIDDKN